MQYCYNDNNYNIINDYIKDLGICIENNDLMCEDKYSQKLSNIYGDENFKSIKDKTEQCIKNKFTRSPTNEPAKKPINEKPIIEVVANIVLITIITLIILIILNKFNIINKFLTIVLDFIKPVINNLSFDYELSFKQILINIFSILAAVLVAIIYIFLFILTIIDEIIVKYINSLILKVITKFKKK